jgi:hypothetical protein
MILLAMQMTADARLSAVPRVVNEEYVAWPRLLHQLRHRPLQQPSNAESATVMGRHSNVTHADGMQCACDGMRPTGDLHVGARWLRLPVIRHHRDVL